MGKTQRRKGNLKTASSAQAAQLLAESGHSVPFISFSDFGFTSSEVSTSIETDPDEIDAEVRNALKKMRKKNYLTREKGLKDLLSHLRTLEFEKVNSSFLHYTAVFPILIMDSVPSIRATAIQMLLEYVKMLKKASEKHLKNVLPYVFFSLSDTYTSVSENAQLLVTKFPSPQKALGICIDSCIEMVLNILDGTHPYLEKNEGDETDMQRKSRITAQALNFLARLVQEKSVGERHSQQLVDLLQRKSFVKQLLDQSPQVGSGLFALINQMCALKWPNVIKKDLLLIALTNLDSPNIQLCRYSAEFILLASNNAANREVSADDVDSVVFNEAFSEKTLAPKIISFIRKKGRHWSDMGSRRIIALLKVAVTNVSDVNRSTFFLRIVDSFFDGLSTIEASFDVDVWIACLNAIISFALMKVFTEAAELRVEDILEMLLNELTKLGSEIPVDLLNKIATVFQTSCIQSNVPVDKALPLLRSFLLCLIERLPHTGSSIINILDAQDETVWLHLCVMLLRHTGCTPELMVQIVNKFDNKQLLLTLDNQISLTEELTTKIDWRNEAVGLSVLAALIKVFVAKYSSKDAGVNFQDYFKLDNEVACLRLIRAAEFVPSCRKQLFNIPPKNVWEYAIKSALQKSFSEYKSVFLSVVRTALDYTNGDALLLQFLNTSPVNDFNLLLEMARLMDEKDYQSINERIANLMLQSLISLPENDDNIHNCAEELSRLGCDVQLVVEFIRNKLHDSEITFNSSAFSTLILLAVQMGTAFGLMILVTANELIGIMQKLDNEFSMELLVRYEFFPGNWEQSVQNLGDRSSHFEDTIIYAINESLFLLEYMELLNFSTVKYDDEYLSSLLLSVAVSSLPLSRAVDDCQGDVAFQKLKEKVHTLVLCDEQLREHLLRKFIEKSQNNLPLTMLLALRTLSDGLDVQPYMEIVNASEHMEPRDAYGYAVALRAKGFLAQQQDTKWSSLLTALEWAWNAELVVSLQDLKISVEFLDAFILSARSKFEEVLFVFQEDVDKVDFNVLSCAMLRLLTLCSRYIDTVDDKNRDFICCGLVTALESCKDAVTDSNTGCSHLFALFAVKVFMSCASVYNTITACNSGLVTFVEEWRSFFCEPAEQIIFCWFMSLSDLMRQNTHGDSVSNFCELNSNILTFCYYISRAIHFCSLSTFQKTLLKQRCDSELDGLKYQIEQQSKIVPLLSLLTAPHCYIQFASLRVFRPIAKEMLLFENKPLEDDGDSEDITEVMERKMPVVCERILKKMLSKGVQPSFLVLDALISCLSEFEPVERVPYCHMLLPYLNNIMPSLFDQLPSSPVIPQYCFGLFYRTLTTVPALVRQWYASLPRPVSAVVNSYTSEFLSLLVWKAECDKLMCHEFPSTMKVRLRGGGAIREIVVLFELDDSTITLRIELLQNYPLSVPVIESEKCIVSRETRRKWILQLTLCVSHQNGTIADAIVLWARNVQKHLEGAEDCTICMCTVNPTTYQLPKVKCKHCKKKFHADCIRRWLESSSQATCPLCRSVFT